MDLGKDEQGIEDKVMLLGKFLERVGNMSGVLDMEEYSPEGIYVFTPDETDLITLYIEKKVEKKAFFNYYLQGC